MLAATGFLRMAADGTATGGRTAAGRQPGRRRHAQDRRLVAAGPDRRLRQCHDHRYDPIPQADYYRLRAVFEPALDPQHWRRPGAAAGLALHRRRPRRGRGRRGRGAEDARRTSSAKTAEVRGRGAGEGTGEVPRGAPRQAPRRLRHARRPSAPPSRRNCSPSNPSVNITAGRALPVQPGGGRRPEEGRRRRSPPSGPRSRSRTSSSVLDEVPGVAARDARLPPRRPSPAEAPVGPGDLTIAAPAGAAVRDRRQGPGPADHRAGGWPLRATWSTAAIRWSAACWSIASGCTTSAGASSTRPATSACSGSGRRTPNCSTGWPPSWSRQGWSLKRMHRLIMTSTAYRQSSRRDPAQDAVDADDALYGRYPVRRLDAEALRDRILAASGPARSRRCSARRCRWPRTPSAR